MSAVVRPLALLAALPVIGALGFHFIERWNLLDSVYMAVTTITTVGFQEVHPLSSAGRVFVIVYLIFGLGVFLFAVVQVGEIVVRAELRDWLGRRRMDVELKSMRDHFIICGFGRMGRTVCRHLADRKLPFVAIDRDEPALAACQQEGWPCLLGDATDDRILQLAGVERARGLAAVLSTDADNLYVVLSARLLSRNLQIISRASDETSVPKMEKAGANRIISLYATGAAKLAQLLANPNVEDFVEVVTGEGRQVDLAEIHVTLKASYAGRTLAQTDFGQRGVIVVGIRRSSGELLLPPASSTVIQPDDCLIVMGKAAAITELIEGM